MGSAQQFGKQWWCLELNHFAEARRVSDRLWSATKAGEDRCIYLQFFLYLTKSCMCRLV